MPGILGKKEGKLAEKDLKKKYHPQNFTRGKDKKKSFIKEG